jgi:hypothetical protein
MSNLYVTEYAGAGYGYNSGRGGFIVPAEPAIQTQVISISGSASTFALSSVTRLVRVMLDGAALGTTAVNIMFGSSGSTGIATTTNASRYVSDLEVFRSVNPYMRVTAIANS